VKRILMVVVTTGLLAGLRQTPLHAQNADPAVTRRTVELTGGIWPGDFNGDGITDLASWHQLRLGNGDGTFRPATNITSEGNLLAVGDFNRDGKLDAVMNMNQNTQIAIVIGNGDGTFGASWPVASGASFVLSADLDGDGYRDLVLGSEDFVRVYPNRGTGSFTEVIELPHDFFPHDGVIADVNGDGRRDILIANHDRNTVSVYLNQGSFAFTRVDAMLPEGWGANDVTTADFNGDGKLDLAVASAQGGDGDFFFDAGRAFVMLGNGDGTFGTATGYQIPRGGWQVVAGDFNRDGVLDIATANRSSVFTGFESCGITAPFVLGDSVSILPGNGNGTFRAASSFMIGTTEGFQNTVLTLNTSDLNGDHATDLIASFGVLLLNRAAGTNAPPTVSAGDDFTNQNSSEIHVVSTSADPDDDMLAFRWFDETGHELQPLPEACNNGYQVGRHTFTVIVDDGHGHQASDSVNVTVTSTTPPSVFVSAPVRGEIVVIGRPYTIHWAASVVAYPIARFDVFAGTASDAIALPAYTPIAECTGLPASATQCEWNSPGPRNEHSRIKVTVTDTAGNQSDGVSPPFSLRPPDGGPVPSPWIHEDIGAVGAPGSESFDNGVFTITGSGADIWGTADEFHYVFQPIESSNLEMTTRVDSVQNVNAWTKAGIMFRGFLNDYAPQASIFVTPGKGIAFQRRVDEHGVSVNTSGPAITAPVWLRMTSTSGTVCGFYRKNQTDAWTLLGCDDIPRLARAGDVGLAVTSHADGKLATAIFSNVFAGAAPAFQGTAIGTTNGSASTDGTNYTVNGSGADIWGNADGLMFVNETMTGDGTIVARVRRIFEVHAWSKAGVMIRDTLDAGSKQVDMIVSAAKGAAMQYRSETAGISTSVAIIPGAAPGWVRLTRAGDVFTGAWSKDGATWTTLGSTTVAMGSTVYIGLAVTSHDATRAATGAFDDVMIQQQP